MNTQRFLTGVDSIAQTLCCQAVARSACDYSNIDATEDVSAARVRLMMVARQSQQRKALSNVQYYGIRNGKALCEEIVLNISSTQISDAVVTRNHYGSLVLNAAHTLFIDVDADDPGVAQPLAGAFLSRETKYWQSMFDDLRVVLQSEANEGFRIYRTAAGYRLLATTHEFEPGSSPSNQLMQAVGADAAFVKLCRIQKNFRARLSPKPWRCGTRLPPNAYPRESAEQQRRFTQWRSQYEHACRPRRHVSISGTSVQATFTGASHQLLSSTIAKPKRSKRSNWPERNVRPARFRNRHANFASDGRDQRFVFATTDGGYGVFSSTFSSSCAASHSACVSFRNTP